MKPQSWQSCTARFHAEGYRFDTTCFLERVESTRVSCRKNEKNKQKNGETMEDEKTNIYLYEKKSLKS